MSITKVIAAACFFTVAGFSAQAQSVSNLKPGEAIIVMPDGRMAIVKLTKPAINMQLKSGLKRLGNCSMFMATANGSIWQVDTERDTPRAICEELGK